MLYDGGGDYIRRYEPRRVPSPGIEVTALLAVLLVAGAFFWISAAASNQASEPDQSFQQLFMWG